MGGSAISRLWGRAPLWRWSLYFAILSGASFIAYPPTAPSPLDRPKLVGTTSSTAEFRPTLPPRPPLPAPGTAAVSESAPVVEAQQAAAAPAVPEPLPPPPLPRPSPPPGLAASAPLPAVAAAPPSPASPGLTRPDPALLQQPGLPPVSTNANLGTRHRGIFNAVGRRVPLPAGEFEVMAFNFVQMGRTESIAAALAQIDNNRLMMLIMVFASPLADKLGTGMRATPLCNRQDIHYREVTANDDFENQDCLVVNHIWPEGFRGRDQSNVSKSLVVALDTRGIAFPAAFVSAYFNNADRDGYLRVQYYFNPELRGIVSRPTASWNDSEWHMNYLARDVRKLDYMGEVQQWARNWHPYVRQAFAGTLQTPPPQGLSAALR